MSQRFDFQLEGSKSLPLGPNLHDSLFRLEELFVLQIRLYNGVANDELFHARVEGRGCLGVAGLSSSSCT